jgi:RNA polymerase sigma factor (sigma-70 family)
MGQARSVVPPDEVVPEWLTDAGRTRLLRFAFLLTGDRSLAEDVVQSVLLRLLDRSGGDAVRNPGAYARRCVSNEIATVHRTRARAREVVDRLPAPLTTPPAPGDAAVDRLVIFDALDVLSERERVAVVLRYYEDLDDVDTAEVIGCTRGTVRTLIHRALPKLREALGEADIEKGAGHD